ncbi:putative inorganic phosphate cotransporter isoform X2 [Parasteatoda tepidariorum]|uniref:putative inorganic phosphate cotransporter isoform X2 n=1 Tax=Parasteatoda tepidariorum TaxID=114398 RepID=UPI001C719CF4|nr:putative inorganic phosphate cotransporter isoform X2 [Parasteatoda tepidariorum]
MKSIDDPSEIAKCSVPKRYIVTLMAFFGLFNAYCMRVNVSVAIVAMVNHTENANVNKSILDTECPGLVDVTLPVEEPVKGERYNWNPTQQGFILSAFFYGYFIAMLPGGYVAKKLGAVRVFGASVLSTAILTLLTPLVVSWGLVPFLVLRFLEGIGEGACYPSVIAIISNWSPKLERSRITSIIFTGAPIGNVFSFIISGLLSSSDVLGGWPSVFYVFGALGVIWYIIWAFLIYETPYTHPSITEEEKLLFKGEISMRNKDLKVPWKSIATSIPFWAVVVTNFGHMFGFNIMITEIPTYLNSILHFNIKSSGILASLPNISDALGAWTGGFISDKLRSSEKLNITTIRKVCNSIAGFVPTICMVAIAFSGCHSVVIIFLLTFGLFLNGFKYAGYTATAVDMTPDFAGVIYGLTNGIGNLSGVIAPTMVGAIISNGVTIANWSRVFCITAGVYFFTTAFFAVFASSELQPWGKAEPENPKEEKS